MKGTLVYIQRLHIKDDVEKEIIVWFVFHLSVITAFT